MTGNNNNILYLRLIFVFLNYLNIQENIIFKNKNFTAHLHTADCRYEGVNLTPSKNIAHGTNMIKEMMVITE